MANKKKKGKKKNKVLTAFIKAFQVTFLVVLGIVIVGGTIFYFKYGKDILKLQAEARTIVAESTEDSFKQTQTSVVYGANGKTLLSLKGDKDLYYINYEDIPNYAKQAMISIEDKKFTTHSGVDYKAIIRAGIAYVKHKGEITQGASTITQQLSRNIFLTHEISWERKIKEMFISMELEKKYSKYQILEFYLNNIYFANGYYGIQAASQGYFNVTVDKLSLSQIAFLCAIPNNPTLYDPIDHPENTVKRRDRILYQMVTDGWITQGEYNDAVAEEIKLNIKETKKKNYVATYVMHCATRALMESQGFVFHNTFSSEAEKKDYEEKYTEAYNECQKSLYSGGYRIYTSIDLKAQKELQAAVDDTLKDFNEKGEDGIYKLQGAAVSIDNETGRVIAIVGGRKQSSNGYTLNRAFQSFRQPGSSIKPIAVYTPAFETGYSPKSYVSDQPVKDGPKNSDGTYAGTIDIATAVAKSKNTIAWKLFQEITPKVGLSYLKEMNFSKLVDTDYNLAASLGGLTIGASPVEMASGFATIENEGVYRDPTCIVKITDSEGKTIVSDAIIEKTIYSKNAAHMMVSCMEGVMKFGTGVNVKIPGFTCAGKTGTTNDKKDGWFVGFTKYYTTSVWVGYDIPQPMSGLSGATYPGQIWKTYMTALHEGLVDEPFDTTYEDESSDRKNEVSKPAENVVVEEESDEDTEEADQKEDEEENDKEDKPVKPAKPDKPIVDDNWGDDMDDFDDSYDEDDSWDDDEDDFDSDQSNDGEEDDVPSFEDFQLEDDSVG